jgi:magnesium chelatase subunit D
MHDAREIRAARELLPSVRCDAAITASICATAMSLGVDSPRLAVLAVRVSRAAAALRERLEPREEDAALAASLVFAARAVIAPTAQAPEPPEDRSHGKETPPEARSRADSPDPPESPRDPESSLQDIVLAAAQAAIPSRLLAQLVAVSGRRLARPSRAGRSGAPGHAGARGRPYGVRSGMPRGNARLSVIETLRAAAPWQRLRARPEAQGSRLDVRRADFRVKRYRQRAQTLTIFAVDASGSSALHRLAEAKGAVELLLAECYIRRDEVAVIAFRGRAAEMLLPPTRSLVRAKRSLAAMAGGGGTPLAAAIDAAAALAANAQRRGETPTIVMLTDGRANVQRDGAGGREAAQAEARRAATAVRLARICALFVDTSPRPNSLARDLAENMNALYIPLPFADARGLTAAVTALRADAAQR